MGHSKCSCRKTYKILSMLPRALSRYLFQYGYPAQAPFLHCQLDYSLCGNILPIHSCILFACSIQTENRLGHRHSCLANAVFHANHWGELLTFITWNCPHSSFEQKKYNQQFPLGFWYYFRHYRPQLILPRRKFLPSKYQIQYRCNS